MLCSSKTSIASDAQESTVRFCRQRRYWLKEAWRRVVFSDESRFELFPKRKSLVRRTKTEKFLPACVAPAVQQGGDAIMIWGCITSEGPGEMRIVTGSINSCLLYTSRCV